MEAGLEDWEPAEWQYTWSQTEPQPVQERKKTCTKLNIAVQLTGKWASAAQRQTCWQHVLTAGL